MVTFDRYFWMTTDGFTCSKMSVVKPVSVKFTEPPSTMGTASLMVQSYLPLISLAALTCWSGRGTLAATTCWTQTVNRTANKAIVSSFISQ